MLDTSVETFWPEHFAQWRDPVKECVDNYEAYLRGLPMSEGLLAQRRARWVEPFGPMPYYLPFWLSEVFPQVLPEEVHHVAIVNVFLYHYYTIKDDAMDLKHLDVKATLIADVILGEALRRLAEAGVVDSMFYRDLSRYMNEAVHAELRLIDHGDTPFSEDDFDALGRKASLAKVSVSALATINKDRHLYPTIEQGLDHMAVGVQLLDDLVDWDEDLRSGRFTYPLYLAHDLILECSMGKDQIPANRVAEKVLKRVESSFAEASGCFYRAGATTLVRHLGALTNTSVQLRGRLQSDRLKWSEIEKTFRHHFRGSGS